MKKVSIKFRVLLLALLPTFIVAVLLAGYFIHIRVTDLQTALHHRGVAIALRLAASAEYGVYAGDQQLLQHLAKTELKNHDYPHEIKNIAFFDDLGQIVTSVHPLSENFSIPDLTVKGSRYGVESHHTTLTFVAPIHLRVIQNYDNDRSTDIPAEDQTIGWLQVELQSSITEALQLQTLLKSSLIMLLGLGLSGFLAMRIANDIIKPILFLVHAVENIKNGNFNISCELNAHGEVATLCSGINTMAKALQKAHSELQENIDQSTADLRHTLETIEIQNIELEISRKDAENSNKAKSEFLANMSHELRTPLNGLIGFINLLRKTSLDTRQTEFLVIIQKSSQTLLSIINEILDFSKIEAGKLALNCIPMDIRDCLEDALTLLAPSAHERHLELIPFVYTDVPTKIIADPLRLKQVITNLVNNAIKYTDKGSIIIRVMLEEEFENKEIVIKVAVTDTGLGLSELDKHKLFHAFNQIHTERRNIVGTGLGLVISKKIIEKMQGKIDVESILGKGSTFWFTFKSTYLNTKNVLPDLPDTTDALHLIRILLYEPHPVGKLAIKSLLDTWGLKVTLLEESEHLEEKVRQASQNNKPYNMALISLTLQEDSFGYISRMMACLKPYYCNLGVLVNSTDYKTHTTILSHGVKICLAKPIIRQKLHEALKNALLYTALQDNNVALKKQKEQIKLLVVDDNKENIKLITALLEQEPILISACYDGDEAVKRCHQESFDLILMDIHMPKMDGIEATRLIRHDKCPAYQAPIVAVTAHAQLWEQEALFSTGVNDYLNKPIDEYELRAVIYKWTQSGTAIARPKEPAPEKLPPLELPIDWHMSLKLTGGRTHIAQDMLRSFLKKLPRYKKELITLYKSLALQELQDSIHKFHGYCCYIGVPLLKQATKEFEIRLNKANAVEEACNEFHIVIKEIDTVLAYAQSHNPVQQLNTQ